MFLILTTRELLLKGLDLLAVLYLNNQLYKLIVQVLVTCSIIRCVQFYRKQMCRYAYLFQSTLVGSTVNFFFCVIFSLHLSLYTAAWVTFNGVGSNRACFVLHTRFFGTLRVMFASSLSMPFSPLFFFFSLFLSPHP